MSKKQTLEQRQDIRNQMSTFIENFFHIPSFKKQQKSLHFEFKSGKDFSL